MLSARSSLSKCRPHTEVSSACPSRADLHHKHDLLVIVTTSHLPHDRSMMRLIDRHPRIFHTPLDLESCAERVRSSESLLRPTNRGLAFPTPFFPRGDQALFSYDVFGIVPFYGCTVTGRFIPRAHGTLIVVRTGLRAIPVLITLVLLASGTTSMLFPYSSPESKTLFAGGLPGTILFEAAVFLAGIVLGLVVLAIGSIRIARQDRVAQLLASFFAAVPVLDAQPQFIMELERQPAQAIPHVESTERQKNAALCLAAGVFAFGIAIVSTLVDRSFDLDGVSGLVWYVLIGTICLLIGFSYRAREEYRRARLFRRLASCLYIAGIVLLCGSLLVASYFR